MKVGLTKIKGDAVMRAVGSSSYRETATPFMGNCPLGNDAMAPGALLAPPGPQFTRFGGQLVGKPANRGLFRTWGMIMAAVLLLAVLEGAGAEPPRTLATRPDECTELLGKIKAIEDELVTIQERKPPFDKMDQKEIDDNIAYRKKEITLFKSRRYALGCPGAELVILGDTPATGGSGTGGRPVIGGAPSTLEGAGLTLKEYSDSIAGAHYAEDDPYTCDLPGHGPHLSVGSSSKAHFNPSNLADGEFTSEVLINGMKARAGSVGEDMQGSWGAVISWTLNGLTYTVEFRVAYPEVKDDTPVKRQELYDQCLRRALEAAIPFDKAMRMQR